MTISMQEHHNGERLPVSQAEKEKQPSRWAGIRQQITSLAITNGVSLVTSLGTSYGVKWFSENYLGVKGGQALFGKSLNLFQTINPYPQVSDPKKHIQNLSAFIFEKGIEYLCKNGSSGYCDPSQNAYQTMQDAFQILIQDGRINKYCETYGCQIDESYSCNVAPHIPECAEDLMMKRLYLAAGLSTFAITSYLTYKYYHRSTQTAEPPSPIQEEPQVQGENFDTEFDFVDKKVISKLKPTEEQVPYEGLIEIFTMMEDENLNNVHLKLPSGSILSIVSSSIIHRNQDDIYDLNEATIYAQIYDEYKKYSVSVHLKK